MSSYKLKISTSVALACFLGILVLLVCSISLKRIFLDFCPATAAVSHTCYPLWRWWESSLGCWRSKVIHSRWLSSIAGCTPGVIFFTLFLPLFWLGVIITWENPTFAPVILGLTAVWAKYCSCRQQEVSSRPFPLLLSTLVWLNMEKHAVVF